MTTRFADHLLDGTHAARPAATAVPEGTLYACTDHDLIYQSDGSAWATWSDVSGSGASTLTTKGDLLSRDGSGLVRLAVGSNDQVLTADSSTASGLKWAAAAGGGGGGAESIERFDAGAAPASPSAQDDEFEDASISGSLTRVYNSGTPKGTWSEKHGALTWKQTASSGTELDVYAQARTISVGDYVEIAGRLHTGNSVTLGLALGFSTGPTFGTDDAVSLFWHTNGDYNRFMLNYWDNHNNRSNDQAILNRDMRGTRWYVRVKYESANTWGLYISPDGHQWHAVQNNYPQALTPTHVIFGVSMIAGVGAPNWVVIDYFRVNAT